MLIIRPFKMNFLQAMLNKSKQLKQKTCTIFGATMYTQSVGKAHMVDKI